MQALIVDDSATACRVLARHLAGYGVESVSVHSAEQALDRLRHSRPDVIFMDHSMPGMDGLETVRALKRDPETVTIPVIMYTSRDGEVYMGQARALGALDVISKDHLEEKLESVITRLHERAQRRKGGDDGSEPEPAAPAARDVGLDELTRQMYLILTEQQRAQKLASKRITETVDDAVATRLERLASRLESVVDMHTETVEEGARRRHRRGVLIAGLLAAIVIPGLLFAPGLLPRNPQVSPALESRLESLSAAIEELRVGNAIASAPRAPDPSSPHADTTVPAAAPLVASADAAIVGHILGTRTLGATRYHEAVTETGFLFGISADGRVGWPLERRYFMAPGCNGDAMVEALPGTVFRDSTGDFWFTPTDAGAEVLRPLSVLDAEGQCAPAESPGTMLVSLRPNDARVTGLERSMAGLRVTTAATLPGER